jgi:hypothetical protein
MTVQTPTRITIEVHPPQPGGDGRVGADAAPIVRVVPEPGSAVPQPALAAPTR